MMEPNLKTPSTGRPRRSILAGIGLLLLLVVAGFTTRQWWWPVPPPAGPKLLGPLPTGLSFSPDRGTKYVAAIFSDGHLRVWESATQHELPLKLPSQWPLNDLAWMPDGTAILVGGFEQHVLMWNLKSAKASKLPIFDAPIVSITVRPRKPELLVSLSTGVLHWLDLQSGERATVSTGHKGIVKVVRYAPNGQTFATGGADGQLIWHDAETRQVASAVAAHQHELSSLAYSDNGSHLVTGSWDNTAKVWPSKSTESSVTLVHPDGIAQVGWHNAHVATSCWDGRLRTWNTDTSKLLSERDCQSKTLSFATRVGHEEVAEVDASGTLKLQAP